MRSDRNALQFSTSEDGTGNPQAVICAGGADDGYRVRRVPDQAVKEGANFNQKLKAQLFASDGLRLRPAGGEMFADAGDEKTTVADHNTEASDVLQAEDLAGRRDRAVSRAAIAPRLIRG